ncbi:hypothetical protein CEQ21_16230 [Niallia circulans]|uniref:Uncharacterized protein n=1 Tax=Niallia circulans TaxID=1397 RepID=A0A553SJ71_NIACI|nr:hypothetical protein [Niallia circulans]TRZ37037.1 hypothetical protein CEQ21_16230 [Niallia circulans]
MYPNRRPRPRENTNYEFRNNGNTELDANAAQIGESGNSDVDVYVNVEVNTNPIAYAMLCSLLATKQITRSEFDEAIRNLERLMRDTNSSNQTVGRLPGPPPRKR